MLVESGGRAPAAAAAPVAPAEQAPDDGVVEGAYVLELAALPNTAPAFPAPRSGPPSPGFFRLLDSRATR